MPVPTKEWVEAQSGVDGLKGIYYRDFAWPVPHGDEDAYWKFKAQEPYIRQECHLGGRVIVYALPTKTHWVQLPPGCPVIIRFTVDENGWVNGGGPMTEDEVYAYREAMYGVKDKPPVRPMKSSEPDTIPEGEYSGVTSKAKYTAKQVKKRRTEKQKAQG